MTLVVDIGLALCFVLTILAGVRNGFFRELFALLGVVGGIWVGLRFTPVILGYVPPAIQHSGAAGAIVFTVLFLLAFAALSITGAAFAALWEGKKAGGASRILGLVLGAARGILLVLFLAGALVLLLPNGSPQLGRSRVLPYLSPGIVRGAELLPPSLQERLLQKWGTLPFPRRVPQSPSVRELLPKEPLRVQAA
jgi:uncharacterized membrane protein required for colicin V production